MDLNQPFAIMPEKLLEIQRLWQSYQLGKAGSQSEPVGYQTISGVCIIPVQGVISKSLMWWSNFIESTSSVEVAGIFSKALTDDSIKGIILDVDSPGGTVDGTAELAETIYQGRDKKPIIAYSDGLMASAAYWIGSAAHQIYISSGTVQVGSIGVVASHTDISGYEKKQGIKTTEIYAGKYKRISSQYRPLSKEGRRSIQDEVDYLYSLFCESVAKNRGTTPDRVSDTQGKIFIGQQAVKEGLADGVSTRSKLIKDILVRAAGGVSARAASGGVPAKHFKSGTTAHMRTKGKGEKMSFYGNDENFEAKVRDLQKTKGISTAKAITEISRLYPELHDDYVARCKTGDIESLS